MVSTLPTEITDTDTLKSCRLAVNSLIDVAGNTRSVINSTKMTGSVSTIVCFGDSLTVWGHSSLSSPSERSVHGSFARQLHALAWEEPDLWGMECLNQGTSGETAYPSGADVGGVSRYAAEVSANSPDIVIVQFGTNDLHAGTSKANFISAMESIIDLIQDDGAIPVIMSIPDAAGINNASDIEEWNLSLLSSVRSKGALWFDWNTLLGTAEAANVNYQREGTGPYFYVHLTFGGNRLTAMGLFDFIRKHILVSGLSSAVKIPYTSSDITYLNMASLASGEADTSTVDDTLSSPDSVSVRVVNCQHQKMQNTAAAAYDVVEFPFYGTSIGIVSVEGSICGQIAVDIDDGDVETVDLYRDGDRYNRVVWQSKELDLAQHTLSIQLKNTKHARATDYYFRLVGFVVDGGGMYEETFYSQIANAGGSGSASRWTEIDSGDFTATPASTSELTMSDTSSFELGLPVKYAIGGTDYYGIISNIDTDADITVSGASLSGDVTNLYVGQPEGIIQLEFYVPNAYADDTVTDGLLAADFGHEFVWYHPAAWFVRINAFHATDDTGATNPYLKPILAGSTSTHAGGSGKGVLVDDAHSTVTTADINVTTANAQVVPGDAIDLYVTKGTNGNAYDLSCALLFILE